MTARVPLEPVLVNIPTSDLNTGIQKTPIKQNIYDMKKHRASTSMLQGRNRTETKTRSGKPG